VPRADAASRVMQVDSDRVFGAFVDLDALTRWLPPKGMSARFENFHPTPGRSYRLIMTYDDAADSPGKATPDSDVVHARFLQIVPGTRVVQAIEFESDDPSFAGTMRMTWQTRPIAEGSLVEFIAEDVPQGISAEDHVAGLNASLQNLARFLAT
jgi:uncharacterized protein YndB with AHSA1/START domain